MGTRRGHYPVAPPGRRSCPAHRAAGTPRTNVIGARWCPTSPGATCIWQPPPPWGQPRPAWDDLIAAFHDHGVLPDDTRQEGRQKTLGRVYRRRVRGRLLELRDPLYQRWNDLWLRRLGPWSPPSHLRHTCHLYGACNTVSTDTPTGANRYAQCSQVAACPLPEPLAGPHRRTEEKALHRRIRGAHAPSHERAGSGGAAPLWIHMHLRDPTSVVHLLHVFAPQSPFAAVLCRARSTMPSRRGDGPGHARARH